MIKSTGPNETIKDSTTPIKITLEAKTTAGEDKGKSTCYYSDTGEDDSYIMFFNTNSHEHSQDLYLVSGSYEYWIKCIDLGGNSDTEIVNFKVETDTSAPNVVRAYHEDTYLKIVTDEEAECVYDVTDCTYDFESGISMSVVDKTDHFTDWIPEKTYYIKCQDKYEKRPNPDECSITVRPTREYDE